MKTLLFVTGFLILLLTEIARVYFIMPFPGSQQADTIELAYFIQSNLGVIRAVGIILLAYPLYMIFKEGSRGSKLGTGTLLIIYLTIFYLFNFRFLAEKMFYQPKHKILLPVADNKVGTKQLVLGVFLNGEAKAYPIEIIGYHHQVRDDVGGEPIMVTYCTVCRTGRVFSPKVKGQLENFRLVGMDHFNAMFEDAGTHSWWRQVTGEAIAGSLKGTLLTEIPSEQMSLDAWIRQHPNTKVLQPDILFSEQYEGLKNYDEGAGKSKLTKTAPYAWQDKSWVVGVPMGLYARAYDWGDVVSRRVINDELAGTPIIVVIEPDTVSFHVWKRMAGTDKLDFIYNDNLKVITDKNTNSTWNWTGLCVDGKLKGTQLEAVQSYQEFWHSWRTFHPQTTQYKFNTTGI